GAEHGAAETVAKGPCPGAGAARLVLRQALYTWGQRGEHVRAAGRADGALPRGAGPLRRRGPAVPLPLRDCPRDVQPGPPRRGGGGGVGGWGRGGRGFRAGRRRPPLPGPTRPPRHSGAGRASLEASREPDVMSIDKLKVALVGCGQIADAHLQEIRKIAGVVP